MNLETKMSCMGDMKTFDKKDRVCQMCKIANNTEYTICKRISDNSQYYNKCPNQVEDGPAVRCKLTGGFCSPSLANCTTPYEKAILDVKEFTGE